MSLKMYDAVWHPKYQFEMKLITLQAIDIVTAQLRDVQDEVAQFAMKAEGSASPLVLGLESTEAAAPNATLLWSIRSEIAAASDAFDVEPSGTIRFLRAGTYLITVTVEHQYVSRIWKQHTIQRDGVVLQTYRDWGGSSRCSSLVLSMAPSQTLSVVNTSANTTQPGSIMFIVLLK